jgi:hypothetical protein
MCTIAAPRFSEREIDVSEGCVRGTPSSFGVTARDCFVAVGLELGVVGRL